MSNDADNVWLRKRLDVIIQLLMEYSAGGALSVTSKVERLLAMGFSQAEAAQVIGKKTNYVSAIVGQKKAGARGKKKPAVAGTTPSPEPEAAS